MLTGPACIFNPSLHFPLLNWACFSLRLYFSNVVCKRVRHSCVALRSSSERMVGFLISLDTTDVQQCIVTNADTANPVGSATYPLLYGFLVSAAFAYGFLLWQMRRARISLRNEVLHVLEMRLQELCDTCLELRNDVDQCGVALDALRSARQRSDDSIASLAHVTGWQLHAHHARLDLHYCRFFRIRSYGAASG